MRVDSVHYREFSGESSLIIVLDVNRWKPFAIRGKLRESALVHCGNIVCWAPKLKFIGSSDKFT